MTMPMSHIACKGAPSGRAQRGTPLVAGLTVLLCLADLGFIDARAMAQEFVEMYRWRTAMGPTVGSPEDELDRQTSEGPQHEVALAQPFAVSKFEVTFEEWDACVATAGCPQVADRWGRGQMPVINASWGDAKQYVAWLSQLTGKEYRLLTEAEWEYAARAGASTRYSWGDDPRAGDANCDGCGSPWDLKRTAPVGSLRPNAFGLHDVHGNVWEWVEDTWHQNYDGAPTDGSAWLLYDEPSYRVVRGGSWRNESEQVRAAVRFKRNINVRFDTLGFRVARTIEP